MLKKWMFGAIVTVALCGLAGETAGAQDLGSTLRKLQAQTGIGGAAASPGGQHVDRETGAWSAWMTQGITPEQRGGNAGAGVARTWRGNGRAESRSWDANRAMSTLGCIGAVDNAVRNAKQPGARGVYRAQSILWSAQWASQACSTAISGR